MKKYVVFFAAVIMIAGAMMMTGCGISHNEGLIGEWAFVDAPAAITTFYEDGTGNHATDWGYGLSFQWSTVGRNIIWNYPGHRNVHTGYELSGDRLTWIMRNRERIYFDRVGQNNALVGSWALDLEDTAITTLNADGTGHHTEDWGYGLTFRWATAGSSIIWYYPGHPNLFTGYILSGDVKSWTGADGLRFDFHRVP